jgi:hypothetical protein
MNRSLQELIMMAFMFAMLALMIPPTNQLRDWHSCYISSSGIVALVNGLDSASI